MENSITRYFIYINGFWSGFMDKTDVNHIGFFEDLFKRTKLNNFEFTTNIDSANVLFESSFADTLLNYKKWDLSILFSGEYFLNMRQDNSVIDKFDILLCNEEENKQNIISFPLCAYYVYSNNYLHHLISKRNDTIIPKKFCCFIVSNGNEWVRNKMFDVINSYKKVDSLGRFRNNVGYYIQQPYYSQEFIDIISEYKFVLCFENHKHGTYMTEKIVNAYASHSVPIYWSTQHCKKVFNENSMLFLENENDEKSYLKLLNQIIMLDNNDDKYLEVRNQPIITSSYFQDNYSIEKICNKFDCLLEKFTK
jgi:hypothetical protein